MGNFLFFVNLRAGAVATAPGSVPRHVALPAMRKTRATVSLFPLMNCVSSKSSLSKQVPPTYPTGEILFENIRWSLKNPAAKLPPLIWPWPWLCW